MSVEKEKTQKQTHTEGRRPCEDRGRDQSHVATGQGPWGPPEAGRAKERSYSGGLRGSMALPIPESGLPASRAVHKV